MRATNPVNGLGARRSVIAANVRVELARANVSGVQMAQRIGLPPSTFGRRMSGVVSFSAEEISAVAAELQISPEVLLAGAVVPAVPVTAGVA